MKRKKYARKVKKILKTYFPILVKCKKVPILIDKNIIEVEDIQSLVNAQMEVRKPILYFEEEKSVTFMLLDGEETLVYIIKQDENDENQVEKMVQSNSENKNIFIRRLIKKLESFLANDEKEVPILDCPQLYTEPGNNELEQKTIKELRKIAKENGIESVSKKTKNELINLITEKQSQDNEKLENNNENSKADNEELEIGNEISEIDNIEAEIDEVDSEENASA